MYLKNQRNNISLASSMGDFGGQKTGKVVLSFTKQRLITGSMKIYRLIYRLSKSIALAFPK